AIGGVLLHLGGMHGIANFLLLMALLMILNAYVLNGAIHSFHEKELPALMTRYERLLRWVLQGKRPVWAFVSLFGIFAVAIGLLMVSIKLGRTKSTFFPSGEPNFVYVYLKLPVGTDV